MIVGHREGEAVGEAFAHSQALHCGQRVIQGIGIIARGIHGKSAVEPGRVCLRGETHHIMQIRVHRRRQRAADHRRILGDGSRGRSHGGRVIAAVDAHGHDRGGRTAVVVRHCNRKGIGQAFTRAQALHCGQRGIQRISIVAVGIHAERAVAARRVAQWREADHIVHIRIRGRGQRAVGNGAAFGDVHGCGGQHGYVVGAVDGHGQGVGGSGAVVVGHRESEGLGQALPHSQALHRRQRIIQAIGIVAVGIQVERAVETRGIDLGAEGHCIMDIRVHRRGQYAADRWRILGDGSRGGGHCGRVIAAVDAHGHDCGRRAAVVVRHCNNECVGQAFAQTQALYRGQ